MKRSTQKQTKIFFYFLIGIALPCLLLGYFALRGIQNDRALMEKQIQTEYQRTAQLVIEKIHDQISEVNRSCYECFKTIKESLDSSPIDSIVNLKNKNPLIEEIFYLQSNGTIRMPAANLLYLADQGDDSFQQPARASLNSELILKGQQFEFQQKDYESALKIYQQALTLKIAPQTKGEIISSIARVQKKMMHFKAAISAYKLISQDYQHITSSSGIQLGFAAQLELGTLYLTLKDTLSAIQTNLDAYNKLLTGVWKFEKSPYYFYADMLKNTLTDIFSHVALTTPFPSYKNIFLTLQDQESKLKMSTDRLLTFQERAGTWLRGKDSIDDHDYHHLMFSPENNLYWVTLFNQLPPAMSRSRIKWGILWDMNRLKAKILTEVIPKYLSLKNVSWQIVDREDQVILKSEGPHSQKIIAEMEFNENFPDWSLKLYQQDAGIFESLLISRRSIYFYMFLLIAGILISGFIFTIRNVTHELELAKMKSDFVSTISHEFKSPLTSIRQLAEMLQTGRVPSEERRQKYYDVILEQSEKLSLLIDNVLDFSRMEEGRKRFDFEVTEITLLLKNIISTFQHRIQQEGFELRFDIVEPLPLVSVDRLAITQAVNNLLDNAIKYSDKKKTIDIRTFIDNQELNISVQDYGIGIKKEDLEKIFDRFYRGGDEATRTSIKGSGLGLTLVKQIVAVHRGTVLVESKPGHGSIFTIKLPIT